MAVHDSARRARVVLVVGASSGIGLAAAIQFAGRGDVLLLAARSRAALEKAARACRDAGAAEVEVLCLDVRDQREVADAVVAAAQARGPVGVVVFSAAVMAYGTVETIPPAVFERVITTAVFGTGHVARAVLPIFRAAGGGTLIVVNSLLGSITTPQMGAYATAKWGQRALVRTLQQELRDEPGIQVCLVSPGSVNTPIYYQAANYLGRRPRPPWPVRSPEHVARVVVGLADRPRQHVSVPVGMFNPLIITGFRVLPFVYDRLVGPAFRLAALTRQRIGPTPGNVPTPLPEAERMHGHWPDRNADR